MIFQVNLCIGHITPPFGYNIFYLKALSPQTWILDLYGAVMPFVLLMIAAGVILLLFPSILIEGTQLLIR